MPKPIDAIRMVQREEIPSPPVARLIGFALSDVEPGRAVITFDAEDRHANPMGALHGGVLCDIADAVWGWPMPPRSTSTRRSRPSS
jgi:acyl-coenzyme A thioesterase PaaI-like protein